MPATDNHIIWTKILRNIHKKDSIRQSDFLTFFKHTALLELKGSSITIGSPSEFYNQNLQKKFGQIITSELKTLLPQISTINFIADGSLHGKDSRIVNIFQFDKDKKKNKRNPIQNSNESIQTLIDDRYTFENFVSSTENGLAFAAAQAVADRPGQAYNPLFIYGDVGLGKTHLLQAIRNKMLHNRKIKNVIYLSSEKIISEIIDGIRSGNADKIRQKYRKTDALIIDDIQFFARKKSTQVEFFHLFNFLIDHHKQIILAADRPPTELEDIEVRLKSRFAMGMTVDVEPPEIETRTAILQKQNELQGLMIPNEILDFIAINISSNVRELVGIFNQVIANYELNKVLPSIPSIAKIIRKNYPHHEIIGLPQAEIALNTTSLDIINLISSELKVSIDDIMSKKRNKEIALARQICAFFCKQGLDMTLSATGAALGGRDHSTVLHSVAKITDSMTTNTNLYQFIQELSIKLNLKDKIFTPLK